MPDIPKVFISYSQENLAYEQKILEFANRLRADGIDADIDLYNPAPKEGWPRWMENRIEWADFVLVVASKSYYNKAHEKQNGKGVSWEVNVIYNILYAQNAQTSKFIPVFFNAADAEYILTPLKGFSYYNISTEDGYNGLYRNLIGEPKYSKPELGNIRDIDTDEKLPPVEPKKQRTSMFFSTPIDLDKWNRAKWKGSVYLTQPGIIPVIGLLFENYSAAREIFSEWRKKWGMGFADDNLTLSFVDPPFPDSCYVYKEEWMSYGKGYFIYIGPNADASTQRAIASGMSCNQLYIMMLSRYVWVDNISGGANRQRFINDYSLANRYQIMPMALKDKSGPFTEENINIGWDLALNMTKLEIVNGTGLSENDMRIAVLKKAKDK